MVSTDLINQVNNAKNRAKIKGIQGFIVGSEHSHKGRDQKMLTIIQDGENSWDAAMLARERRHMPHPEGNPIDCLVVQIDEGTPGIFRSTTSIFSSVTPTTLS